MSSKLFFLAQLAATLYMVGLIWFVQVVHYPLFDRADRANFPEFSAAHQRLTGYVVMAPMLVEMATALVFLWHRPEGIPAWTAWLGLALLAVIWVSTAFAQVPQHEKLTHGYDAAAHHFLVLSNWIRTVAWTGRGLLLLILAGTLMK